MKIFRGSIKRELAQVAGAVFVTLFTVLATTQSIRLLGEAAAGRLASEAVVALLGFSTLGSLPVLLSLTVFLSVLLVVSRQYRDSEMVVWFASGQSLTAWLAPVLAFAAPFVILIGALSLGVSPWAAAQAERYKERLEARDDAARITPGAFKESAGGERVFFVETVAGDEVNVQNVFISSVERGRSGVMVSRRGFTEIAANGDKFLVMVDGRRYEGVPGRLDFRVMDFSRYAVRVQQKADREAPASTPKQLSTLTLVTRRSDANDGELVWRIGLPLSAATLAMLAIPLAFVNPRVGRSVNLVLALLIYLVYSNCLSITQAWVAQGRIGFASAWWLVHLAMVALLLALYYRRLAVNSVFRAFARA
ncbi:MAG: LPS export ABC transporter permease LptF [Burkholderiales bacterium]|nr:LPS export ABC transporter permease LptF [Burkholderiales bacterium]